MSKSLEHIKEKYKEPIESIVEYENTGMLFNDFLDGEWSFKTPTQTPITLVYNPTAEFSKAFQTPMAQSTLDTIRNFAINIKAGKFTKAQEEPIIITIGNLIVVNGKDFCLPLTIE